MRRLRLRLRTPALCVLPFLLAAALSSAACSGPGLSGRDSAAIDAEASVSVTGDATERAEDAVVEDSAGDASSDVPAAPPDCPCFDGPGDYCEAEVAARAITVGCVAALASATGRRLLHCAATGAWTATQTCASGCETGETGASASCSLAVCDCFVRVSWCGASAARHGLTLSPPCRVPLVPDHDSDILGCNGTTWVVQQTCTNGCLEAPTGTPDACISSRTPQDPGWAACPHQPLLHAGLHPEASDRLRCAGITADRISQTIGYASASAGYHAPDGTVDGLQYTAAVDLRVSDLTETEIRALLVRLGHNGFAAWYRKPGYDGWPSSGARHIHAVFAGVVMKSALRGQVRDFLSGLNGLASHTTYRFWTAPPEVLSIVRLLFSRNYTP